MELSILAAAPPQTLDGVGADWVFGRPYSYGADPEMGVHFIPEASYFMGLQVQALLPVVQRLLSAINGDMVVFGEAEELLLRRRGSRVEAFAVPYLPSLEDLATP